MEKSVISIDQKNEYLVCLQQGFHFAFQGQIISIIAGDVTPRKCEGSVFSAENILC